MAEVPDSKSGASAIHGFVPDPATLDAMTMRSADLRIGFAEVASECYAAYQPDLARLPGHSSASVVHPVRIRRHLARDEADASWDPRHRRLR
jgi:hypothetical protein